MTDLQKAMETINGMNMDLDLAIDGYWFEFDAKRIDIVENETIDNILIRRSSWLVSGEAIKTLFIKGCKTAKGERYYNLYIVEIGNKCYILKDLYI